MKASSGDDRIIAAYELVDWLRLVNQPLGPQEMKQITLAVMKFYPAAMQDIFENLAPQQNLWRGSGFTEILIDLPQLCVLFLFTLLFRVYLRQRLLRMAISSLGHSPDTG